MCVFAIYGFRVGVAGAVDNFSETIWGTWLLADASIFRLGQLSHGLQFKRSPNTKARDQDTSKSPPPQNCLFLVETV